VLSTEGRELHRLRLPAPALALWFEPESEHFSVVVVGLGEGLSSQLLHYHEGQLHDQLSLGDGVYQARWHHGLLSLHYLDGRVRLCDGNGKQLAELATGMLLDDCYLPGVYATLERVERQEILSLFRVEGDKPCPVTSP
jgi:hypothetical protein